MSRQHAHSGRTIRKQTRDTCFWVLATWSVLMAVVAPSANAADLNQATQPSENAGQGTTSTSRVSFVTDVVPVLTKLGCNGGGCHGKATGQNGFKISLFGFEPEIDYAALVHDARGRRLFPADPDRSLLLMKATAQVPHGGGRRVDERSGDYRILRDWIVQGTPGPDPNAPRLDRIELEPKNQILERNQQLALRVTAHFSDGTARDVTRQAIYQSNEPQIAEVNLDGVVATSSQPGLFAVMTRFGEQIATFHGAVPFVTDPTKSAAIEQQLDSLQQQGGISKIDQLLIQQWRRMRVLPSPVADDATFIRRASIDVCGTLPTSAEVESFVKDQRPDKRQRLIDHLLERPEYASYFALKWADILQNRGAGYSTSKQRSGTKLFASWIRDSLAANKPYDQFVSEIVTASGSQLENPPAIWYRSVRKSPEYVESVAQAFLGVRVQCAQCHHHPTERWSQADYFGLAAVFARVGRKGGFADAEVPTNEVIYLKMNGEVHHPRTGELIPPKPLGGPEFEQSTDQDPRRSLARWMIQPDNPFFARTMVNRMWAHFLGRGLVHPIDDARSTNPPSNPELYDQLAQDFIASGFDIKHLIRSITTSRAYGLEAAPQPENAGDFQSFSRFYPRRMTAEVLLDGMSQVLEVSMDFPGVSAGTRAIDLPDENVPSQFLDIFGRPARMSACECERVDAPALTQALELVNSTELQRKLTAPGGYAAKLANSSKATDQLIRELFLQVLSREPQPQELHTATDFLQSESDRKAAIQSLLWSLIATNEFLFNH